MPMSTILTRRGAGLVFGGASAAAATLAAAGTARARPPALSDAAGAAASLSTHVLTSYNVLEWELDNLQGDTLDEAAEERRDGEWPPMHSAPALSFALGRPPPSGVA